MLEYYNFMDVPYSRPLFSVESCKFTSFLILLRNHPSILRTCIRSIIFSEYSLKSRNILSTKGRRKKHAKVADIDCGWLTNSILF
jgi:hypothetical protein